MNISTTLLCLPPAALAVYNQIAELAFPFTVMSSSRASLLSLMARHRRHLDLVSLPSLFEETEVVDGYGLNVNQ